MAMGIYISNEMGKVVVQVEQLGEDVRNHQEDEHSEQDPADGKYASIREKICPLM